MIKQQKKSQISENITNNKRIAKNTVYLYIRMFLIMGITLYTSRIVLEVLGVEDYGIYNIVGGTVSILAFFTSSLSNATQRFLSFELGENNFIGAQKIFNQSCCLYFIIAILLVIACETIGLWFLKNKLVIPIERQEAAFWVFQCTVGSMVVAIFQVPFISIIIARERMSIYAYLGIFDVTARLCITLVIRYTTYDELILYAAMMFLIHLLTTSSYAIYCFKKFTECKIRYVFDKDLIKKLLYFITYNLFGCFSYSIGVQGINVILNLFFGLAVNAARGIAVQGNSALIQFTNNILTAIKPQIIKSYATGNKQYMMLLLEYSTKYSFLFMLLIGYPILFSTNFLLTTWLGKVPHYTNIFIQLLIIESLFVTLFNPLWIIANATGNIKHIQVYGRLFTLAVLPISYILLKCHVISSPVPIFMISVLMQIGYWLYSLYDIHRQISLNIIFYFKQIVFPIFSIGIIVACIILLWEPFLAEGWIKFIILSVASSSLLLLLTYSLALKHTERLLLKNYISKLCCKNKHHL